MRYEFVVAGTPSEVISAAFPQLVLEPGPGEGVMSLRGALADRAAVRAVLAALDDLGLTLLEMRQLSP